MKYYVAPLEGLTGYIYRNAHHAFFNQQGDVSKYFSPFVATNERGDLKHRDRADLLPEHNQGIPLVPQILSNRAEDFLLTQKAIQEMGYQEVNINLGCPSGTVVSKNKGSGFLALTTELDRFLYRIFEADLTRVSIKTRLGKFEPDEFERILAIYNRYPISELIIHPRVQKDMYKYSPRMTWFQHAVDRSKAPLCYNGDIHTINQFEALKLETGFEELKVQAIMLGRGILKRPGLIGAVQRQETTSIDKFKAFHETVLEGYIGVMSGDRNVLFKMKELWYYMADMFDEGERPLKRIKKAERVSDYRLAVDELMREAIYLGEQSER